MEDRSIEVLKDNIRKYAFEKAYCGNTDSDVKKEYTCQMNYYVKLAREKGVSNKDISNLVNAGYHAGELQYLADTGKL